MHSIAGYRTSSCTKITKIS